MDGFVSRIHKQVSIMLGEEKEERKTKREDKGIHTDRTMKYI